MATLALRNKTELRETLIACFNEEEMRTLCSDLGIDYENLAGMTKVGKARELIDLLERLERTRDLLALCSVQRPSVDWQRLMATTLRSSPGRQATRVPIEVIAQPAEVGPSLPTPPSKLQAAGWMTLLAPPTAWLIGHVTSLLLVGLSMNSFVVLGTLGGVVCILLITLLGSSVTGSAAKIEIGQLVRASVGFLLAGLLGGFVGLSLWLIGCPFQTTPVLRHIGCNDTSTLVWRLASGFSSLAGLAGASAIMLVEFGVARVKTTLVSLVAARRQRGD